MKVLIVEDDNVSRKLADSILTKNGYKTLLAGTVQQAIDKIESSDKISLILLDIKLPDQDGFSLQTYLKSKRLNKKIPVIMCTSAEDEDSVMQSISLGAIGYIKKPIKSAMLLAKVENIIINKYKTVLIVDDEKMIRDLLGITLEREGYNAITVESGVEALKMLESQHIDVVLTDIEMPEICGLELLKTIKTKYNELPVMMITGQGDKYSESEMKIAGADGYIKKPFKNIEILKAINDILMKCQVS